MEKITSSTEELPPKSEASVWADSVIALLDEKSPTLTEGERKARRAKQRPILEKAYPDLHERIEGLKESWRQKHGETPLPPQTYKSYVMGHVHEALAVASLPEEEHPYRELERFLLEALQKPQLWYATIYVSEGEGPSIESQEEDLKAMWEGSSKSKERRGLRKKWEEVLRNLERGLPKSGALTVTERELYREYLSEARPSRRKLSPACNSDAITVTIKTDPKGKPVAMITGLVEAKNHQPDIYRQERSQGGKAREALVRVVKRYQKVFPLLVRSLGLSAELPENIDIATANELSYTILLPEGVPPPPSSSRWSRGCKFEHTPFTRRELTTIADAMILSKV